MSYLISAILPRVAAKLNDPAQTNFTNAKLLPYAQDAGDELQLELELNGILVLEKKNTTPINVTAGWTDLLSHSILPTDMLEPQRVEEKLQGSTDLYMPMTRRMWTPDILPTDSLRYWDYREENIYFVGATSNRSIVIYYLKRLIDITSVSSVVAVNNSQQFMINRIGGLAARFIGENPTRADELDKASAVAMNKLIRIGVKSKQGNRTRRRPYQVAGRRHWM